MTCECGSPSTREVYNGRDTVKICEPCYLGDETIWMEAVIAFNMDVSHNGLASQTFAQLSVHPTFKAYAVLNYYLGMELDLRNKELTDDEAQVLLAGAITRYDEWYATQGRKDMTEAEKVQVELEQAILFQKLWDRPMSRRGRLSLPRLGGVNLTGLDHGAVNIIGMSETTGLGTILTLHEAGSSHWVGRGMERGYSGAATFTVLIQTTETPRTFRYVQLTQPVAVKSSEADRRDIHWHYFKRLQEEKI